jgi:hypothetical protein
MDEFIATKWLSENFETVWQNGWVSSGKMAGFTVENGWVQWSKMTEFIAAKWLMNIVEWLSDNKK